MRTDVLVRELDLIQDVVFVDDDQGEGFQNLFFEIRGQFFGMSAGNQSHIPRQIEIEEGDLATVPSAHAVFHERAGNFLLKGMLAVNGFEFGVLLGGSAG